MDLKNAKYELTAVNPDQYPVQNMPEIALVGRSNVGKSSLINTLLNRKNLARVASTPGKTREINFYNIDRALYLVDLPGYGYARVSKSKKESWDAMIETYLMTRKQLKLLLMLIDIRHTPSNDDQLMLDWIKTQNLKCLIIATKLDKIPRSQINKQLNDIRRTLDMTEEEMIIPFSSASGQGTDQVWGRIKEELSR